MSTNNANKKKTLQQEINDLRSQIGNLRVSRNRSRSRGASSGTTNTNTNSRNRSRSRQRLPRLVGNSIARTSGFRTGRSQMAMQMDGIVRFGIRELVLSVNSTASSTTTYHVFITAPVSYKRSGNVPPQLATLAKCFEQFRFVEWEVEWEPLAAATTTGSVIIGISPCDAREAEGTNSATAQSIAAMQPSYTGRVYEPVRARMPKNYLHARRWYAIGPKDATISAVDSSLLFPGVACLLVTHANNSTAAPLGNIWIRYRVELQGFANNS